MDAVEIIKRYREAKSVEEKHKFAAMLFTGPLAFLKGYIFVICHRDLQLAEEVFSDTIYSIVKNLHKAHPKSENQFKFWAKKIAFRRRADIFRDPNVSKAEYFPIEELEAIIEASTSPMKSEEKDDYDFALKLLEEAGPHCREIIRLRIFEGMEPEDIANHIAAIYGTEYKDIRAKIKRCLKCARELAKERGLTYANH